MQFKEVKTKLTPKAIVATARKIAAIFYKLIHEKIKFNSLSIEKYMDGFKEQQIKKFESPGTNI